MRDAPYAGIFVAVYEKIKRKACEWTFFLRSFSLCLSPFGEVFNCLLTELLCKYQLADISGPSRSVWSSTVIHTTSAASAGLVSTMITHPFDVIKVCRPPQHLYIHIYGIFELINFLQNPYVFCISTLDKGPSPARG